MVTTFQRLECEARSLNERRGLGGGGGGGGGWGGIPTVGG